MALGLAIADSNPNSDGSEILVVAVLGVLAGLAAVVLSRQSQVIPQPPPGGCTNCPANQCVNNTCVPPVNHTCQNCPPPNVCVLGACLVPNPPPVPCIDCPTPNYCPPGGGACILVCDPACESSIFPFCDASNCLANGFTDGCGSCVATPPGWTIGNVTITFGNGQFNAATPLVGYVGFTYTGPGGNVTVGFDVQSSGILGIGAGICTYSFGDPTATALVGTGTPTQAYIPFNLGNGPGDCFLCNPAAVGAWTWDVTPLVFAPNDIVPGALIPAALSC